MESKDENQSADKQASKGNNPQNQDQSIAGKSLRDFPKEDLLNLEKGAAAMDQFGGHPEKIEGKTLSGAGSGPGTGDAGGDFDRPGTAEGMPVQNDYVEHELPADVVSGTTNDFDEVSGALATDRREKPENIGQTGDEASGYPGGGAVRTAEDRIPPAPQDENTGWSPETPLNQPHNPLDGGKAE